MSSIQSSPRRVCVCENDQPQCTDIDYIFIRKSATLGEKFIINAMLVGSDFGATTGGIFATADNTTPAVKYSLYNGEEIQQVFSKESCTALEYSVNGTSSSADVNTFTFILTTSSLNAETLLNRIYTIFSNESISISIQKYLKDGFIRSNLQNVPIVVSVDLLPCPLGLEFEITSACAVKS